MAVDVKLRITEPVLKPLRCFVAGVTLGAVTIALPAGAVYLPGDLDGDGHVGQNDESIFKAYYDAVTGDSNFEPAADIDADGKIDTLDLAIISSWAGTYGGEADTAAPGLLVSLNDIEDDMNDLLVAPPEMFRITLALDGGGQSAIDTSSLSITSSSKMGALPAGTELAPLFAVTPTRAVWEVPAGTNLDRVNYFLAVSASDLAGNQSQENYGFAVRDFAFAPPLENLQLVHLDFEQDRSGSSDVDFVEDLRDYGLSSANDPTIEALMLARIKTEVLARVHPIFGRNPDGSPGLDPVNILFVDTDPGVAHTMVCIGGSSSLGGPFLGSSILDVENLDEFEYTCDAANKFGIFPQAIEVLWGNQAEYLSTFTPVDASLGGTPVGEHPLDAIVTDAAFDPASGSSAEIARYNEITNAVDGFAQVVAGVIAHETGHLLGLVAHGAAPGGLWGGTSGGSTDHNVATTGGTPAENYLMNAGGSFSFDSMAGRNGYSVPWFRELAWAYLHDRIALNGQVTGLFPAPLVDSVTPNPVAYGGAQTATVTVHGDNFVSGAVVQLIRVGDPTPDSLNNLVLIDSQTLQGSINRFKVPADVYDVHLINGDGQELTLIGGLTVTQ